MVEERIWQNGMKRIRANSLRRERAWRLLVDSTIVLARLAHPATGGNGTLVHNWGNAESRRIWGRVNKRWQVIGAIYDRRYDEIIRVMQGKPTLEAELFAQIVQDNRQITRAMESVA